jgi:hypothetical protein
MQAAESSEVADSAAPAEPPRRLTHVYARLPPKGPYYGTFHYAPSAGNRSSQTFFRQDIRSLEVLQKQHDIRTNPVIGIFHYGDDVYGERFTQVSCQQLTAMVLVMITL